MGFTITEFKCERYTVPLAYVCIGISGITIHRNNSGNRYNTRAEFDIYYSQEEKSQNQPIIDRKVVNISSDDIPTPVELYDLCKTTYFNGYVLTDIL